LIERLRDAQCFSDYFHERYSKDQTRWHAVHNGLYEYGIPEIRAHCQAFVSDCDLAVGLVGELTSEAARVLSQVRFIVLRSNVAEPEYDDIKALLMLLYPLHCPWSFLDGEIHKDRLLRDIERI